MTIDQAADKLAHAIATAANEHGTPNSFSFGELAAFYGGPPPTLGGRAAKAWPGILDALGATVDHGRVHVE
jgi:hypothetical protein